MKKTHLGNFLKIGLIILVTLFLSCEKENINDIDNNFKEVIDQSIISKLESAGLSSEGLRIFQNGYLVENDIYLTENQINNLAKQNHQTNEISQKHYRTNNIVKGQRTIYIFMDPNFGTFMQNALDKAINRYNALDLKLTFKRTTQRTAATISSTINITTFFENSNVLGISAGFPVNGNPANTILFNTKFYNNRTQRKDAVAAITHEIGHAIGFRHTDFRNRAFSCGGGNIDEGVGAIGANYIDDTPIGASANSWMLACSNDKDRPFTNSDIVALNGVYGAPWLTDNRRGFKRKLKNINGKVTGLTVREQYGYGIINARLINRTTSSNWTTTNQRGFIKSVSFNDPNDFAVGIEVREQYGYGIIDARLISQTGRKTNWVTNNPRANRILNYVAPVAQRIISIQAQEQYGYGIIDLRVLTCK